MINYLALLPLWSFQMSSQIIAISDFEDTLIMWSLETIVILLNIWLLLMIDSTTWAKIGVLVFFNRQEILKIFRYDLDCSRQKTSIFSSSMLFELLTYLSIVWRLSSDTTLLVTIIIPTCLLCTKLAMTSNLIFFRVLLRLVYEHWMLP